MLNEAKKKLRRPVLSKLIQDYIQDYIVDHKLSPGDPLPSEGWIAEELGVSRASVREAVRALESLGTLKVLHGSGIFVRKINFDAVLKILSYNIISDPSALLDLLSIRRILESGIIPEVVQKIQEKDLEECRRILSKWEENLAAGSLFNEQDRFFHQTLYRVIENQLLLNLVDVFWIAYRNAEAETFPAARLGQNVFKHHQEILQAIEARDARLAQRLMFEHFQEGEEFLKSVLVDK